MNIITKTNTHPIDLNFIQASDNYSFHNSQKAPRLVAPWIHQLESTVHEKMSKTFFFTQAKKIHFCLLWNPNKYRSQQRSSRRFAEKDTKIEQMFGSLHYRRCPDFPRIFSVLSFIKIFRKTALKRGKNTFIFKISPPKIPCYLKLRKNHIYKLKTSNFFFKKCSFYFPDFSLAFHSFEISRASPSKLTPNLSF